VLKKVPTGGGESIRVEFLSMEKVSKKRGHLAEKARRKEVPARV